MKRRTFNQRTEEQEKVRQEVIGLVEQSYTPREIVRHCQPYIDNGVIDKRTIYKYITEASKDYINTKIVERIKQNVPEEEIWILDFITEWRENFKKETSAILKSNRKYKIRELGIYVAQLEKMLKLIRSLMPERTVEKTYETNIPIRMPNEMEG